MNAAWPGFFGWLLRSSGQAAILMLLIFLAQMCLRNRLDGRWRHALWLLVLVRLALPFSPSSPASVFNYIRFAPATVVWKAPPSTPFIASPPVATTEPKAPDAPEPVVTKASAPPAAFQSLRAPLAPAPARWQIPSWRTALPWIWALGALGLLARAVMQEFFFRSALRASRLVDDRQTLEIFAVCRALMGVKTPVTLAETSAVSIPALHGLFRPRLLLPRGFASRFSAAELRHIFLHELAHVRRRDMPVQWLAALLQIIHWFNPVLWFGFRRMAADREVACDELALAAACENQRQEYGRTIVKLLEDFAEPPLAPGLVGMLEDKSQIKRRISLIARFHRHSRWSLAGAAAIIVLGLATLTGAQTEKASNIVRPDLRGVILTTNGQPAHATVFIYTAGPKIGTSPYCPSCYADCRKSADTDATGHFTIASLDPELRFRILVVGEGFQPRFVNHVDPATGPVTIRLETRNLAGIPPEKTVIGRVVDANGAPIAKAKISATGIHYKNGKGLIGDDLDGVDPVAVSGPDGRFVLASRVADVASFDLKIEARGYANRSVSTLPAGKPVDLRLTEGASIKGRVLFQGRPLANVAVGVVSEDREYQNFSGDFDTATDPDGKFQFINLPPNTRYQVYALMDSVKDYGATPVVTLAAGADGSTADAGDLIVGKANEISGRVVLPAGQSPPAQTRLQLGREDAWDSMIVALNPDGSFHIKGVPSDTMSICLAVDGYSLSAKNKSLDKENPFQLIGRVNGDINNLIIDLDKTGYHGSPGGFAENQLLREDPLHGAEAPGPAEQSVPARTDHGSELAEVFKPCSTAPLGNRAGASAPAYVIKVPIPPGDNQGPDWSASADTRREILTRDCEAPHPSFATSPNSDAPAPSLANSDFAHYLANPPWIKSMTYAEWTGYSAGNIPPQVTSAKWILETNLLAMQPNGYFSQALTYDPDFYWASWGGISAQGMSKDWFWHGTYWAKSHGLSISPRPFDKGASEKNNPEILAHWRMEALEQIRHLGFPTLQPNTFAFHDAREFSATTLGGQSLKGSVLSVDGNRPASLIYKVGDTNRALRVDYRYREKGALPAYIEINPLSPTNPQQRNFHRMLSIEQVEYGLDPTGTNGYGPSRLFPDMNFDHVQLWKNGKRLSVAPDGRQVTINN